MFPMRFTRCQLLRMKIVRTLESDTFPVVVLAVIGAIYAPIYFLSPQWATDAGIGTRDLYHQREVSACKKLIGTEVAENVVVVHGAGRPIVSTELADWTPQRVEAKLDSGLSVVSTLGQNGDLQYVVKELNLPVGTVFRVWHGTIVRSS